jgi:hypothetical protein
MNLFLDTLCYQAQISNSTVYLATLLKNILVKLFKRMIRGPWCDKAQIFHFKHAYLSNILLLFKYMNKMSSCFWKLIEAIWPSCLASIIIIEGHYDMVEYKLKSSRRFLLKKWTWNPLFLYPRHQILKLKYQIL